MECTGAQPGWEHGCPRFLEGRQEIEGRPEPLGPGDDDECGVERWEDWGNKLLRPLWDEELGSVNCGDDAMDDIRLE